MENGYYLKKVASLWRRFRRNDAGGATVEAVLWMPAFIGFFVLVADVSFVFHRQTQILTVLQDGNRALSVGRLASLDDLEEFVLTRVSSLSNEVTFVSEINDGVVTSNVQVPVNHLVAVGMFEFLNGYNINVGSQQFIEY